MPDRKATWNEYLFYLMNTGRWPAAASTASRIAAVADPSDTPLLKNYVDAALEHGDRPGGMAVWKALCRRGLLPFGADRLLFNGDLSTVPSARGFDWRAPLNSGVSASFRDHAASFSLSGFQPEHAVLLEQPLSRSTRRKSIVSNLNTGR